MGRSGLTVHLSSRRPLGWDLRPMRGGSACETIGATSEHERTESMPRIRIMTDPRAADEASVMLDERICTSDLSSAHFARRLLERIGWAVADADDTERHQVG